MSRINTNVSALVAQNALSRSNNDLQIALNRLSTGLRINVGKDDPAGLIASENLRRDITAINRAIGNTERANQLIATADSALGQVSSLLNDIRGLVTEAANSGALSDEQIAANQLQVDSSLEAIDRISRVTTFQGRRVLDGSLDFIVAGTSNYNQISNLQVQQANLGTTGSVAVTVAVNTAATQAQVDLTNIPAATSAVNAFGDVTLTHSEAQATGAFSLSTTGTVALTVNAVNGGSAQDASGNGIDVIINDAVGATTASYNSGTREITISADLSGGAITGNNLATAIQAIGGAGVNFTASATNGATLLAAGDAGTYDNGGAGITSGGRDSGSATIRVTSDTAGTAANGVTVTLVESASIANNSAVASFVGSNIQVAVRGTVSYSSIASQINGLTGYGAAVTTSTGDQDYVETIDSPPAATPLGGGVAAGGGVTQDVVFELAGRKGSEVFSFAAGTSISTINSAINALSDATGVNATINGTTLELRSEEYGTDAFVDIKVVNEAAGGTITAAVDEGTRDAGTDVSATVNGLTATGEGNALTLNSTTLDLSLNVNAGFTGNISFNITGGGALFQLGPDVVSNQQARLGISSVSTATLGGTAGRLYELRNGEDKALATDPNSAALVVDQVITKVTELRGRLGAFQKTTLQSNIVSLTDTATNLTEADSSIRDADFAKESARLTRAQILVQSGTAVLTIANQNPQNVLSLLR